jgi:hypothetical protein
LEWIIQEHGCVFSRHFNAYRSFSLFVFFCVASHRHFSLLKVMKRYRAGDTGYLATHHPNMSATASASLSWGDVIQPKRVCYPNAFGGGGCAEEALVGANPWSSPGDFNTHTHTNANSNASREDFLISQAAKQLLPAVSEIVKREMKTLKIDMQSFLTAAMDKQAEMTRQQVELELQKKLVQEEIKTLVSMRNADAASKKFNNQATYLC